MQKTKTKILAGVAATALLAQMGAAQAAVLSTPTATDDSTEVTPTATDITWDDTYGGTDNASGSIDGIVIKATVMPVLNFAISTEELELGMLLAGTESTQSLNIEVGTNSVSGVNVTARSANGGLENQVDNSVLINNATTDGVAESYTFSSVANATDASNASFAATGLTAVEVNDTTTEHSVYSTNKPEITDGLNDVTFTVGATSTEETPAGEYEDTLTFTVTASF